MEVLDCHSLGTASLRLIPVPRPRYPSPLPIPGTRPRGPPNRRGRPMPFVQITMLEGRTVEQKHDLIRKLTDATAEALGGDPGRIRVVIYEVSSDSWGIGGDPVSQRPPTR